MDSIFDNEDQRGDEQTTKKVRREAETKSKKNDYDFVAEASSI